MKTKVFTLTVLFTMLIILPIYSQITEAEAKLKTQKVDTIPGWKTGGVVGFNLAQTALVNWAAGGEKSFAVNGIFSVFANYKKGKIAWDNSMDVGYGLLSQGEDLVFKKTDDKIDLLSKFGREAYKNLYYAGLFNFKSQMTPGYNYLADGTKTKISDAFAPAYIVVALGVDYKPTAYLSMFAAPVTGKITFVADTALSNAGAFGVEPGNSSKSEFGGYVRMIFSKNDFKKEFLKNVSFTTKLDLFSNYAKDPQNVVVNWETQLAFKVNKYINVNLNTHLIYDDKIDIAKEVNGVIEKKPRVQFKEIFGIGLSFKF
jgi:hypothetical protein